jgi:hypothetical protein
LDKNERGILMEVTIQAQPTDEKDKEEEGYRKWDIDCAVDTLIKAESIKQDAKMMALVKPLLMKKFEGIKKITSLDELKKVSKERIAKLDKASESGSGSY